MPFAAVNSGKPMAAVVTGAVASERRLSVWVVSILPILSMARKLTVWLHLGEGQGRGVGRKGPTVDGYLDALDA